MSILDIESESLYFDCPNTFYNVDNTSVSTFNENNSYNVETNENDIIGDVSTIQNLEVQSEISAAQFVNRTRIIYDDDNSENFSRPFL